MELNPFDRQLSMPDPHDLMVVQRFCSYCQRIWQASTFSNEGVVSCRLERALDSLEDSFAVMFDGACLSVAQVSSPDYSSAESVDYSLVSQADT